MNNIKDYDAVVVGSGFAGAVVANKLATAGNKVVLLEKRNHIGGNMYECYLDNNYARVHLYGPHIFHTDNMEVASYVEQFCTMKPYYHKVVGHIDGQLVPIPFNFKSIDLLFDKDSASTIKQLLQQHYDTPTVSVLQLLNSDNNYISRFGKYVYDKVFVNYTAKQWGVPIDKVDTSVINRVPVRIGYNDHYFGNAYQCMPLNGYNEIFDNMLTNDNIKVIINCNAADVIGFDDSGVTVFGQQYDKPIIYSGAVDELLHYQYGQLDYRTVDMVFENIDKQYFQSNSVINYPNEHEYTRITEFKYLTGEQCDLTTILYEYPSKYDITKTPYYPVNNQQNQQKYNQYVDYLKKFPNIYLCGRLAEYKYYDMDKCIEAALSLSDKLLNRG